MHPRDRHCRRHHGEKPALIRETFVLGLLDRLRNLTEPTAIIAEAIEALGQQLGANRVGYGQMLDDDATIVLRHLLR